MTITITLFFYDNNNNKNKLYAFQSITFFFLYLADYVFPATRMFEMDRHRRSKQG